MPKMPQMDLIAELKKRQVKPQVREGKDGALEDIITGNVAHYFTRDACLLFCWNSHIFAMPQIWETHHTEEQMVADRLSARTLELLLDCGQTPEHAEEQTLNWSVYNNCILYIQYVYTSSV